MHKNTLLVTSFFAVIAALLVGISIGRSMGRPASTVVLTPTPTPKPTTYIARYQNKTCGINFEYVSSYTLTETASGTATFAPTNPGDLPIVVACQEDIPRVPLPPEQIETIVLKDPRGATYAAQLYHNASPQDGTPVDTLIFNNPKTKLDVVIAGFGPLYDAVLKSLSIL